MEDSRPRELNEKIQFIKDQANFLHEQHHVRDGVVLHVFVRHEGYDQFDNLVVENESTLPGAKKQ